MSSRSILRFSQFTTLQTHLFVVFCLLPVRGGLLCVSASGLGNKTQTELLLLLTEHRYIELFLNSTAGGGSGMGGYGRDGMGMHQLDV